MTADQPPPAPPDLVALVEAYGNAERDYMLESRMAEISCRDDLVNEAREAADTAKAALLAALGHAPAPTGERVPSARWAARHGSLWFAVGDYRAQVMEHGGWTLWLVNPSSGGGWVARADGEETGSAAQLAAEDALLAVRDEITRAVGRSE